MNDSTVSGNSARFDGGGGGIDNRATLINTTVSGNSAFSGGGIRNLGTANLTSSLISGNTATNSANEVFNSYGTITANNSLFGDSNQSNAAAFSGFTPSTTNNITATFNGTDPTALSDILEVDSMGNPLLADNGGPTLTIALVAGSPAINAGSNTELLEFDQRGEGFVREFDGQADIGAFEIQSAPNNASEIDGGETAGFTITENSTESVATIAASDADDDELTYSISGGADCLYHRPDHRRARLRQCTGLREPDGRRWEQRLCC